MPMLKAILEDIAGYKEYNPETRCLTRPTKSSRRSADWKVEQRDGFAIGCIPITHFKGKRWVPSTPQPHPQDQEDEDEDEADVPPSEPQTDHDEAQMRGGGGDSNMDHFDDYDYTESKAHRRGSRHGGPCHGGSRHANPAALDNRKRQTEVIQRHRDPSRSRQSLVPERATNGAYATKHTDTSRRKYSSHRDPRGNERNYTQSEHVGDVRADVGSSHSRSASRHPPDLAFEIEMPPRSRHSSRQRRLESSQYER